MEPGIGRVLTIIGRETGRIVLPSPCIVCERELPWRDRMGSCCGRCWESAERVEGARCSGCGLPWSGEAPISRWNCGECLDAASPLAWRDAWGWYRGPLRRILHAFKFERHDFLACGLAAMLQEVVVARSALAFDAIVPVPLHPRRLRARGYNQAELLARHLARSLAIPLRGWLDRIIDTRAQSTLPRDERQTNVHGAFRADIRADGAAILIVDDVMTTGATLEAGARALAERGASRISAVTVARA